MANTFQSQGMGMNRMKGTLPKKEHCCGCQACADQCPVSAIQMRMDEEGFWYPSVNQALCTGCGGCESVCPMKERTQTQEGALYLGVQAKNNALRYASSSGGVFSLLSLAVLKNGGVVYGAGYNADMEVMHQRVESMEQLETIRKTKYVQSSMAGIYRDIRCVLRQDRQVLFCGTPCQAQALKQFLNGEDNGLILVDLVCYGAGSPGIWRDYVTQLERQFHGKLERFFFRDKRNRNHGQTRSFIIGGREFVVPLGQDAYCRMYFRNYCIRPACHHCGFCKTSRSSDLTIGDFWGVEKIRPDFDDGMGTSLVIVRTEKAKALWREIEKDARWFACGRDDVLQPRLLTPTKPAKTRKLFMTAYRHMPFSALLHLMSGGSRRRL